MLENFDTFSRQHRISSGSPPLMVHRVAAATVSAYMSSSADQRSALKLGTKQYSPPRLTTNAGNSVRRFRIGLLGDEMPKVKLNLLDHYLDPDLAAERFVLELPAMWSRTRQLLNWFRNS